MLVNDNDDSRRMVEQCYKRHKTTVNPIIDWTDAEVWEFIRVENIKYCGLYDCGFQRLGCIGCPMAGKHTREKEFLMWPKYLDSYVRSFNAMLLERKRRGKENNWGTGLDVFRWWMEYDILPGQISFFESEDSNE